MKGTSHMIMAVSGMIPMFGLDPLVLSIAAAGATAPDVDLVLGQRFHRRLTHWWPAWTALAVFAWWRQVNDPLWSMVLPFALGGLFHLVGDILTPSGIPLGVNPMHRHRGLGLFSTGTWQEMIFIVFWTTVALGSWWLRLCFVG